MHKLHMLLKREVLEWHEAVIGCSIWLTEQN